MIGAGWVAEPFKAPVLKTGAGASPPWVRIPPHPPVSAIFYNWALRFRASFYSHFPRGHVEAASVGCHHREKTIAIRGRASIGAVEIDDGAPLLFDLPAAMQKKGSRLIRRARRITSDGGRDTARLVALNRHDRVASAEFGENCRAEIGSVMDCRCPGAGRCRVRQPATAGGAEGGSARGGRVSGQAGGFGRIVSRR